MNTKFFGQFLLEKSLINRDQLLEALDEQRRTSPLLGDLAIEQGLLDHRQAEKINQEQRRQDKRFGDIAIALGLLNEAQIEQLLAAQKARRQYFGEILVGLGYLSKDALATQLAAHKAESAEIAQQIDRCFSETGLPDQAKLVSDVFTRFYHRMFKILVSIEAVGDQAAANTGWLFWSQSIKADQEYHLVLAMPADHACFLASRFIDMDIDEINELSIDAVAEFLNTFTGHVYSKLGLQGDVKVSPPVFHEQQCELSLSPCGSLLFDSGQFEIEVVVGVSR